MLSGIQCGLCGAEFSSQPSFQAHQREPGACERQAFEPLEGIDALTKMKLQDKKVARGAPEDAKWRAMYSILFPDDDPSTYPDPCELPSCTPEVRDHSEANIRFL